MEVHDPCQHMEIAISMVSMVTIEMSLVQSVCERDGHSVDVYTF